MTRSILLSLVVIGAVVGLVAGAGTFAVFTDTQTGTAEVDTGTISLYLADGGDDCPSGICANEVLFEGAENMVPGETKTWPIRLINNGTHAWDVTDVTVITGFAVNPGGLCDYKPTTANLGVVLVPTLDGDDHGVAPFIHVAPGGTEFGTVNVVLPLDLPGESNDNECQGVTWSGTADVTVTQD
jgi:predicted ribosomally synthesized peptide with SipW-like signal peptide